MGRRAYFPVVSNVLKVAEIAAMAGDPARANILLALGDGRALPAGELAYQARVTPQTASGHLGQMVEAGLLAVKQQGRHRYYRLASSRVAAMMEAVMAVAAEMPPPRRAPSRIDPALQAGRTCYDHLGGRLGVALTDHLLEAGHVCLQDEVGEVTDDGLRFLTGFGLALKPTRGRVLCKACIDWSERRPHLSGQVGVALCRRLFDLRWVERAPGGRAVVVTSDGRAGLQATFGIAPEAMPALIGTRLERKSSAHERQENRSA